MILMGDNGMQITAKFVLNWLIFSALFCLNKPSLAVVYESIRTLLLKHFQECLSSRRLK